MTVFLGGYVGLLFVLPYVAALGHRAWLTHPGLGLPIPTITG